MRLNGTLNLNGLYLNDDAGNYGQKG